MFYDLQAVILSSDNLRKYDAIFKAPDLSDFPDCPHELGNEGYSRHAMLRAFIMKHLDANPALAEMCGFEPRRLPHNSQFYRFVKEPPNSFLLRKALKSTGG